MSAFEFPRGFPRRGEIYWAPAGTKTRPVLIVSSDHGNQHTDLVVVAGMTTQVPKKKYPVNVHLPANQPLPDPGVVLCRSVYTLPKTELQNYRASLSDEQMAEVDAALRVALGLS